MSLKRIFAFRSFPDFRFRPVRRLRRRRRRRRAAESENGKTEEAARIKSEIRVYTLSNARVQRKTPLRFCYALWRKFGMVINLLQRDVKRLERRFFKHSFFNFPVFMMC